MHHALTIVPRVALASLFVLIMSASALGQGTDGRLPDPMGDDDLARYAQVLSLSQEQRFAADAMLESYLARFKLLREGEIERALRPFETVSDREQIAGANRRFNQQMPHLLSAIRTVDESLFDEMDSMLTEAQRELLPRVRLARDRDRLTATLTLRQFIGRSVPDLGEVLRGMEFPPVVDERLQPMVIEYEHRLTSLLREVLNAALAMHVNENKETAVAVVDAVDRLRQYNRRTFRTLESLLDEHEALALRRVFHRLAYAEIYANLRSSIVPKFDAALSLPDLTDEQREGLVAMRADVVARQSRLLDEAADFYDRWGVVSMAVEDATVHFHQQLGEIRVKAKEIEEAALASLLSVIGDGRRESLADISVVDSGYGLSVSMTSRQSGLMSRSAVLRPPSPAAARPAPGGRAALWSDGFLPPPIGQIDLARYARRLDLDETGRAAMAELHEAYLDDVDESVRPLMEELREATRYRQDEPPEEAFERQQKGPVLRWQALAAFERVDERFINRLAELTAEDSPERDSPGMTHAMTPGTAAAIERIRRDREYRTYARGSYSLRSGPNLAANINLVELADRLRLDGDDLARIDPLLVEYETEMIAALRERFDRLHKRQVVADESGARFEIGGDFDWEAWGKEYILLQQRVRESHNRVIGINQRTVARIVDELGWSAAWPLLDAFNREAYPMAFDDASSVEAALDAAFEIENLSSGQRSRLGEIAAEYRPAYAALRESMVKLCADFAPDLPGNMVYSEPEVEEARRHFERDMAQLTFERDNLNRRALRQIKSALNARQLEQLAAHLPETAAEPAR